MNFITLALLSAISLLIQSSYLHCWNFGADLLPVDECNASSTLNMQSKHAL